MVCFLPAKDTKDTHRNPRSFTVLRGQKFSNIMIIKTLVKFNSLLYYRFQILPKRTAVRQNFDHLPYVPPILGRLLDLISPAKINISEPRLESYDPWDMAN